MASYPPIICGDQSEYLIIMLYMIVITGHASPEADVHIENHRRAEAEICTPKMVIKMISYFFK